MSSTSLGQFLRDERGSFTLWSLVWFLLYAAIGGLAVDVTDAFRNQSMLQSTADAAALAGALSLPNQTDVVDEATAYARLNMNPNTNGVVLPDTEVQMGTWDFGTETFSPGSSPPNAVHVITQRSASNGNPVLTNFLRVIGLRQWDVNAEAIAVRGVSECSNNGLIAGDVLDQRTSNGYYNDICIHGVNGMKLRQANYFQLGTAASTTCSNCLAPYTLADTIASNPGFGDAWAAGGEGAPLFPLDAYAVSDYVDVLKSLPSTLSYDSMIQADGEIYAKWAYLYHPDGSPPALYQGSTLPATLNSYTVYSITCSDQIGLPSSPVRNAAIISTCPIQVPSSQTVDMQDVAIAVDWHPADKTYQGIHFAAGGSFGNGLCGSGGKAVELYTNGSSVLFAASGQIRNLRIVSAWDVTWAAQADGRVGASVEAVDDIIIRTQSNFGLCPNTGVPNGPHKWTYRLVR